LGWYLSGPKTSVGGLVWGSKRQRAKVWFWVTFGWDLGGGGGGGFNCPGSKKNFPKVGGQGKKRQGKGGPRFEVFPIGRLADLTLLASNSPNFLIMENRNFDTKVEIERFTGAWVCCRPLPSPIYKEKIPSQTPGYQ